MKTLKLKLENTGLRGPEIPAIIIVQFYNFPRIFFYFYHLFPSLLVVVSSIGRKARRLNAPTGSFSVRQENTYYQKSSVFLPIT